MITWTWTKRCIHLIAVEDNQSSGDVDGSLSNRFIDIVDGRNPAPPDMYETLLIVGNLPYQLVSRISCKDSIY